MADLIQQNMGKITGDNNFKLSKSITYLWYDQPWLNEFYLS